MQIDPIRLEMIHLFKSIKPYDDLEKKHLESALQWVESGAEMFRIEKPAIPDPHLVAYFPVFSPKMDQILLVDHKKACLWLPTGGHVEKGEHPQKTVEREVLEELGIEASFLSQDPLFLTINQATGNTVLHTDVSIWYALQEDPQKPLAWDRSEFHQIRWFPIEEIPFSHSDTHLKRFIEKVKQQKNHL